VVMSHTLFALNGFEPINIANQLLVTKPNSV